MIAVDVKELLRVLGAVSGIVDQRADDQMWSHVLLTSDGFALSVTAKGTSLEASLRIECEGEPATTAIPYDRLVGFIRGRSGHVQILPGSQITLKDGRAKSTVRALPNTEWPSLSDSLTGPVVSVPSADLRKAINAVAHRVSHGIDKPQLQGVLLDFDKGCAVTADTPGTAIYPIGSQMDGVRATLPLQAAKSLLGLLGDGDLKITAGDRMWRFDGASWSLTTLLICVPFPDVYGFAPQPDEAQRLQMDRDEVLAACGRVIGQFGRDRDVRNMRTSLQAASGTLTMTRQCGSEQIAETVMAAGELDLVGIDPKNLQDFLNAADGETLYLDVGTKPGLGVRCGNLSGVIVRVLG